MKKLFVEAEIEVVSISVLDDVMTAVSGFGDDFSGGWDEDGTEM